MTKEEIKQQQKVWQLNNADKTKEYRKNRAYKELQERRRDRILERTNDN